MAPEEADWERQNMAMEATRKEKPISIERRMLVEQIENLSAQVKHLASDLQPVLRSIPASDRLQALEDDAPVSELADFLRVSRRLVQSIAEEVAVLRENLDL